MSVPCRYDLDPKSCINDEVKVYNRKLKKHLKAFGNSCVIEVDSNRGLFTRHGLHMNSKGKEQIAGKIVKTIKAVLHEKKSVPIMMKDKEDPGADNEGTEIVTTTTELDTNQKNLKNGMHSNNESVDKQPGTLSLDITGTRSSVMQKKAPKSMSSDFLW